MAAAYGIQSMVLQGFYVRAGVDSTAVEALFNYTQRANSFQKIGGAQFISTFFDVLPPQNLLPSTYQVCGSRAVSSLKWKKTRNQCTGSL